MTTAPTSKQKYATLLAKKCLLSPSAHEIEALLGLDLDIDWSSEGVSGNSLFDLALSNIGEDLLLRRWWAQIQRNQSNLNAWSPFPTMKKEQEGLSLFGGLFLTRHFSLAKELIAKTNTTDQDWKNFAEHPAIIQKLLTPWFHDLMREIKDVAPDFVIKSFQDYRDQNLWLTAKNKKEFVETQPKSPTPQEALLWWEAICNNHKSNSNLKSSEKWRFDCLWLLSKEPDKAWTQEQCVQAILAAPAGFASIHAPIFLGFSSTTAQKLLQKAAPCLPSSWFENEVAEVLMFKSSNYGTSSYMERAHNEKFVKSYVKTLSKHIESSPRVSPQNKAVLLTLLDVGFLKTTSFSERALSYWKAFGGFATIQDLFAALPHFWRQGAKSSPLSGAIAPLIMHNILSLPDQKSSMAFVGSLDDLTETKLHPLLDVVAWSVRATTAAPPEHRQACGNFFWKFILKIPQANQHFYLKKAYDLPAIQVPLAFWDSDFEAKLDKAMSSKRTQTLSSLLSKMSLLNQANQVTSELEEPKENKRRSKM